MKKKKLTSVRELMIFFVVVGVFVIMSIASPYFLTPENLLALLLSLALEAIMAIGMMDLFVAGQMDMSIGSILALSGGVTALMLKQNAPVWAAVLVGLLVGAAVGVFNGFTVAVLGVSSFVTTLASQSMGRGLVLVFMNGKNIGNLPKSFTWIGQNKIGPVQLPIVYMVIMVIIGDILLRKSRFFRQYYYIGGNFKAARLSGIQVSKMNIINYTIMGVLAGFAGIVTAARLGSASTTAGSGMEFKVITAVIIGGASMSGGEGSVIGGLLGCTLMALISNAMTLLNVNVYWQTFVTGLALLIAVLIDRMGKIRQEKAGK